MSILSNKMISIFVILTSINFIYSTGCCNSCKKDKNNNVGGGKTDPKKSSNPLKDTEKKKFENRMTAIKSNLESFLKNSKIRKKRNYLWEVSYSNDGSVTIKYCNFTGFIAKKEIDKIEDCNAVTENYSDNIMVAVEVKTGIDIPDKHNIKDPTCTLDNLIKSLNSLGDLYRRIDGPEYLCVENGDNDCRYIDLSNSVVYGISNDGYLCKIRKTGELAFPRFKDETFYGINNNVSKSQENALKAFKANNENSRYTAEFIISF